MRNIEEQDFDTLIELAMEQVTKLSELWASAMTQICERQDRESKQAA